jgi:hypothetical protein
MLSSRDAQLFLTLISQLEETFYFLRNATEQNNPDEFLKRKKRFLELHGQMQDILAKA